MICCNNVERCFFVQVWIFGDIWCSVWLAVDVWMCTASILNLCAISLDRYVAVTRPVTYPSIMSMGRAKVLIAAVWVLSFTICFPPLVGWREEERLLQSTACPWTCELINDSGYVIYSALGSFYIPMFVMLFFYWRIYRAAINTTRAINRGFRTTKSSRYGRFDEQRLTLRIHRGRGSVMNSSGSNSTGNNSATNANSVPNSLTNSPGKSPRGRRERIKISVSYPSSDAISTAATSPKSSVSASPPGLSYSVHYAGPEAYPSCQLQPRPRRDTRPRLAGDSSGHSQHKDLSPSPTFEETNRPKLISRMGKRNIKAQVKRFRMETKAAKTLGIIVGGFIVCWLPFFTIYFIGAFCSDNCINPTVFSVLFWLGYCNSAINPCIYALFSKDFRFAFKKIICRCLCGPTGTESGRRGSDGSQLGASRRADPLRRSSNYNNNNDLTNRHSDSDQNNEPQSDSR